MIAFAGAVPRSTRVPILIVPPAFPQGSMDGSDLARAVACENTHGATPLLGRPERGSLSPSERPVGPRAIGVRRRKTPSRKRLRGHGRVNRGRQKM